MVSAVERSDALWLTKDDFNRALGWMIEAEAAMPDVFKAGAGSADASAIEEIYHFVLTRGNKEYGLPEQKIMAFAKDRIPLHSIPRIMDIMVQTGKLAHYGTDKRTGVRYFKANLPEIDSDGDLA